MGRDTYTGNFGGNWFDPLSWSGGVPASGDTADIFGSTGVDASAGIVAGVTIDLSAAYLAQPPGDLQPPTYNLVANTLGTRTAPVSVVVTADSGTPAGAGIAVGDVNGSVTVDSGQNLVFDGGEINGNILVDPNASLAFEGYADSRGYETYPNVTFDGNVDVEGGTLFLASAEVTGTGRIEIARGGLVEVEVAGPFQPSQNIAVQFDRTGGTLEFASFVNGFDGVISGFGAGAVIKGPAGDPDEPLTATYRDGVLSISQDGHLLDNYSFAGNYSRANFDVRESTDGFAEITYAPCFATGTLIAAPEGLIPVERLVAGRSAVCLATGGTAGIVWIGHRRQRDGKVVRVRAHALGHHTPSRDLIVSTDHALYFDGVLVPAGRLVNGETIVHEHRDEITFWHVELRQHGVLLAEGAPAESYLDTGNRSQFSNCPLSYGPPDAAANDPCAEVVLAGPRLERIKAALAGLPVK